MPLLARAETTGAVAQFDVAIPANYQVFEIIGRISGYSASGIAGLYFNADLGNNYFTKAWISTSTTMVNTTTGTLRVATVGITGPRGLIWARVEKRTTALTARVIGFTHSDQEGATVPIIYNFMGQWNNTAALINRVGFSGNGTNLNSGSYIEIWGARDTL